MFGLLVAGEHRKDPAALTVLAAMPMLFEGWRARAAELAAFMASNGTKPD